MESCNCGLPGCLTCWSEGKAPAPERTTWEAGILASSREHWPATGEEGLERALDYLNDVRTVERGLDKDHFRWLSVVEASGIVSRLLSWLQRHPRSEPSSHWVLTGREEGASG